MSEPEQDFFDRHDAVLGLDLQDGRSEAQVDLQQLIDLEMSPIRQEIADGDLEFALRLIVDMLTKIRATGRFRPAPLLRHPFSTGSSEFDAMVLAGIRWAMNGSTTEDTPWLPPQPLPHPRFAYGHRKMTDGWKQLFINETPSEFACANIFIRERSLTSI